MFYVKKDDIYSISSKKENGKIKLQNKNEEIEIDEKDLSNFVKIKIHGEVKINENKNSFI